MLIIAPKKNAINRAAITESTPSNNPIKTANFTSPKPIHFPFENKNIAKKNPEAMTEAIKKFASKLKFTNN